MKNCIIIGVGQGVSQAIARKFGSEGYRIGLVSRNADNLRQVATELDRLGIKSHWAAADAGDAQELDHALSDLRNEMGVCDVLIYNAAVLRSQNPFELSSEALLQEFQVNLLGAHRAVQKIAPEMIEKGQGAILFTGGGLSLEPFPEWTSLALGKAALRSYALSLFKELGPKGVHVSVLAICGIVVPGGPFDPDLIAEEYWRVATAPDGVADREVIYLPEGSDPFYNDPEQKHRALSLHPFRQS